MINDDINALLGIKKEDIIEQVKEKKQELAKISPDDLGDKIINETNELLLHAKNAVQDVLMEVQSTPNDAELIESASKLIQAQTGLIESLSKLHLSNEKFKQQVALTKMKIDADKKINDDNNATKILMSREEVMAKLMETINPQEVVTIDAYENEETEE